MEVPAPATASAVPLERSCSGPLPWSSVDSPCLALAPLGLLARLRMSHSGGLSRLGACVLLPRDAGRVGRGSPGSHTERAREERDRLGPRVSLRAGVALGRAADLEQPDVVACRWTVTGL